MKKILACLLTAVMAVGLLTGCGQSGKGKIYPIQLDGTEIIVNETKLQALFDAGFEVSFLGDDGMSAVEPSTELDENSIYSGIYIGKNEETWASLEVVTEEACAVSEAPVSTINIIEDGVAHAQLDGVALTELTPEKAVEKIPGLEDAEYWQSYITKDTILRIERTDGSKGDVVKLEQEYTYEIDYSSSN